MHIVKWKKPIWYILYQSSCFTFWKRQNHGHSKMISGYQGLGWRRDIKVEQRELLGQRYPVWYHNDIIHVIIHFFKPREYITPKVNPNVKPWSEVKWSRSVVSNSSWPHGLCPARLLGPWDFPGKNTGVGCHCIIMMCQCRFINCNKCTTLVGDVDNVGSCACVGAVYMQTLYLPLIFLWT